MSTKFFRLVLIGLLLFNFSQMFGQDYVESALLFSRTRPAGSSRILGMGGAQTALGGDYSSGLSNPAGLGMFNRSEFTITPGFTSNKTTASYFGNNSSANRAVFNIPGLSCSFYMPKTSGSFLGGTFSVSFQRTNDYNRATTYGAPNNNSSIVDYFIDQAHGYQKSEFKQGGIFYNAPTGLAYHNYLIGPKSILNPPGSATEYFTDAGYPKLQQEEILVKGASSQWSFSYGANFNDKFFLGGGIGITSIRYKSQKIFSEMFTSDTLQSLQLTENLDIRGTGLNATLGAIGRPVDFLQIGISFTTPTIYSITETYDAAMNTRWNNFDYFGDGSTTDSSPFLNNENASTDLVTSTYSFTTPLKVSTGIAFISKYGLLTADVEFMNPTKATYSSTTPGVSFTSDNNGIKSTYKPVVNYRIGAEFREDIFRLRAGYAMQPNAYRTQGDNYSNNQISSVSAGAGIRTKDFYVDFALISSSSKKYFYQPYTFSDGSGPVVNLKNRSVTGMVTVGFIF